MITIGMDPGSRKSGLAIASLVDGKIVVETRFLGGPGKEDYVNPGDTIRAMYRWKKTYPEITAGFVEMFQGFSKEISAQSFGDLCACHGAGMEALAALKIPAIAITVHEWRSATLGKAPKVPTSRKRKDGETVWQSRWTKAKGIDNLSPAVHAYLCKIISKHQVMRMTLDEKEAACIAIAGMIKIQKGDYTGL